jgi:hypothetical protein
MGINDSGSSGCGVSVGVSVAVSCILVGSRVSDGIPFVTPGGDVAGEELIGVDGRLQAELIRIMISSHTTIFGYSWSLEVRNRTRIDRIVE